jgi:hypothetical protein
LTKSLAAVGAPFAAAPPPPPAREEGGPTISIPALPGAPDPRAPGWEAAAVAAAATGATPRALEAVAAGPRWSVRRRKV